MAKIKETNKQRLTDMMEVYFVGENTLSDFVFAGTGDYLTDAEVDALDEKTLLKIEQEILRVDGVYLDVEARKWRARSSTALASNIQDIFN